MRVTPSFCTAVQCLQINCTKNYFFFILQLLENDYAGRFTSTEFYHPDKGIFTNGLNMGIDPHKIRDAETVLPSGNVLVAGGALQPELFHFAGEEFISIDGELSGPQMFATSTLLPSGEVLVLGGYDQNTQSNASAYLIIPNW